jgi:hypothetical protein
MSCSDNIAATFFCPICSTQSNGDDHRHKNLKDSRVPVHTTSGAKGMVATSKTKSVAEKMGIKKDSRALLVHAPLESVAAMKLPGLDIAARRAGEFDYIHLFAENQKDLHQQFPKLKKHLRGTGMLWVSWPKGGQLNTDLNIKNVIKIGYDYGLVESKALSVDDTWSALKFTHPRKGKIYKNSFGRLKETPS